MLYVTCIANEEVLSKMDTHYVMDAFVASGVSASVILICTDENVRQESIWEEDGEKYYAIRIPYEAVKSAKDARPLLLEAVAQKLGLPLPEISLK